ncbi:serine/threonine protein kinase [Stigmatella aurantiaca]|uniref:Serine/threonine protein kinase n=1 Tax=Stigmatella aurantiaca TaxID=41 RepID=A0A1H7LAA0_STIAU|nr:serine/threonine-protein kinase [Stigmatella aurantiaca]SEK95730.1 serine/threonine protein kinase [Stigmatella aurantiaca]
MTARPPSKAGDPLPPGLRVDGYLLVRRVAVGATSEVYLGRHATEGTLAAVKVLNPEDCAHPEAVARFLNEAQVLQELQHPHLIRALSCGVLAVERPFMVLEWLPEDLHHALERSGGRLPHPDSARIIQQVAQALSAMHAQGRIHRDLKPANILVACAEPEAWSVKLADLGLAKHVAGGDALPAALPVSTADSALLGTWDYMAPEQWARSKRVGVAADLYSLGVLWFQLLAGRVPFVAQEAKDLMFCHVVEPPPLDLLEGVAPSPTRELIARLLEKKPEKRPALREVLDS